MPDVARKRVSSVTEVLAPRSLTASNHGDAMPDTDGSGANCLPALEPVRLHSVAGLLMARLDRAMRSVSLRRLVGVLGAVVALMTALSYPVGYGIIGYWKGAELLSFKADLSATRAARFILENDATWRNDGERLASAIDVGSPNSPSLRQRITDTQGAMLVDRGDALAAPTYARSAPISIDQAVIGHAVVISSLRPLLIEVGLIAIASLTLGVAAFLVFAVLPLKVLDRSLSQLECANARFREQNRLLDAALANMFQGLAMFDAAERLVIANNRFAEMYGLTAEQLERGTPLRRIFERRLASGAYPGETVDEQLQIIRQHFARRDVSHRAERLSDGRTILVSIRSRPEGGWVTTHQDVTERENLNAELARQNTLLKQREDQLETQNRLLDAAVEETYHGWSIVDAALNNMSQGLAMFDAERRLIVCNSVYQEMYGLTTEQVKPGVPSREIVALRIAAGNGDIDAERVIDDWFADSNCLSRRIQHLADGRIISVCRHRLDDGRLLVTHEDITEREKLYSQLAQQNELLKQREDELKTHNEQFDAALKNMSQGLSMFDAERRLVICNELYARMYGLTDDQVKPGTTLRRIMEQQVANGCHSDESADEIQNWMQRRSDGKGTPQFVSELKDGRSVSVSAQERPGGGIVTTHQDITEQRYAEARIVHMALHDTLTGLPNRTLLNERLEHALTRVRRGDEVVAVHVLDLDHFKVVNDTLGHPIGDTVLKMVTERLRVLVRETDTVARMGGDEFAIVQVAIAQPADATSLARRIVEVVGKPYDIEGHEVEVGATIGIAMGPADGLTPDELMRNADLALYRAKGDGRGTFCFFEPEMDALMQARRALEYDLGRALAGGEFEMYYQPVIDLKSNEISGFEALIRWRHPRNGMVQPDTFIPLAEKIGAIVALGEWAIRNACNTAMDWPDDLKVAVNLSPLQFRSPALVEIVASALEVLGAARAPTRARHHRAGAVGRQRDDAAHPQSAARAGCQAGDGRFRHGLFVAQLSAQLPLRQDQDRPLLRQEHRRRYRLAQHRACGGRDGAQPRHDVDRGGGGDGRAAGDRQGRGLHRDARVSVQPGGARA